MTGEHQVRPNYLGIGAQKCASSWLHRILGDHPQVAVPEKKEIDFFSFHYDRGYQWYERMFRHVGTEQAVGEVSPSYFCEPAVPGRVAQYMPSARILLSLRDPVERALSNHRHEVRAGNLVDGDLSFETGLRNNPMYVEQGLYATHLRRWLQHFPMDSILVIFMEDVEARPQEVARRVYRFLGVEEAYVPAGLGNRYNHSFATRSVSIARTKDALYGLTRTPGLGWLWDVASGVGLRALYRGLNQVPSSAVIPPPREATLHELRDRFEPEIRALESLTGRSLATWLEH